MHLSTIHEALVFEGPQNPLAPLAPWRCQALSVALVTVFLPSSVGGGVAVAVEIPLGPQGGHFFRFSFWRKMECFRSRAHCARPFIWFLASVWKLFWRNCSHLFSSGNT